MTQRQYDAATAEALMRLAFQEYKDKDSAPYTKSDDGLYVNEDFRAVCPPGTIFDWTPADDMGWSGSPNPDTAPFLPVPFAASELAACMLDGPGQSIQSALDRRIGYPLDDGALNSIPARYRWMREALHEAYALAATAQSVVGEFDHDEEARVHKLAQQYDDANGQANDREGVFEPGISPEMARARRERAATSVLPLKMAVRDAQEASTWGWQQWRAAMVRQLLSPVQPQAAMSASVVADSASNAPEPLQTAPAPVEPPSTVMKRKALIAHLEHEWPTIEADLSEATRNGLKDAAATGKHGKWYVEKARAWAQQEGKLKQAAPAHPLASAWAGAITRNRP